jgi:hypothetical protein
VRVHGVRGRIASNPTPSDQQKWEQAAQTSITLLSQHLGVSLSSAPALPVVVELMSAPDPTDPPVHADSGPVDQHGNWASSLGAGVRCRIRVYPVAWKSANPDQPIYDMAHEVAHCFQFKLNPADYSSSSLAWLQEGGAEWAGDQVAREVLGHDPNDPLLHEYWNKYLDSPSVGLFSRTYTAVGFFAHLLETASGGSIWPTLREMWKSTGGSSAAYNLAVPDSNTAFLDSWASGYARDPSLGPGWDTTGVGITATKPVIPYYAGGSNTQVTMSTGPRSSALAKVLIADQVLEVTAGGGTPFGRLRDASGTTFGLESGSYCVEGQNCSCPPGTPGSGSNLPPIAPGVAWVALTANNTASHVTLARTSAANWCNHPTAGGGAPVGQSNLAVAGAATGSSYLNGQNDGCSIHQQNPYPPGLYLQCLFLIREPGGAIGQLTIATFHYTGPGYYHVIDRGTTTGPDVGFADLSGSFTGTSMPPDAEAGGFTISAVNGNVISGGISAEMENVDQFEMNGSVVTAGGTFQVPVDNPP